MTDTQSGALSIPPSTASLMASLRAQSTSTLQAAIRGNTQDATARAEILRMANTTLALYFDPDLDPETKAGIRQAFVVALCDKPLWAVTRAFDAWVKTMQRRPSPGEIGILADRELRPMTDELARRQRDQHEREEAERQRRDAVVSKDAAAQIMARAGFTPGRMAAVARAPMALTFAEAERISEAPPVQHWTETADPDGPEMAALRRARDANPHVIEARRAQARWAEREAGGEA